MALMKTNSKSILVALAISGGATLLQGVASPLTPLVRSEQPNTERLPLLPPVTPSELSLRIDLDKERYHVGDEITVTCVISNQSAVTIMVLPWGGLFAVGWLDLADRKSTPAHKVLKGMPRWPMVREKDFVAMEAGQEYTEVFRGKILKGDIKDVSGQVRHGLFIDFESCAFQIPTPGEYQIRAKFSTGAFDDHIPASVRSVKTFRGTIFSDWRKVSIE